MVLICSDEFDQSTDIVIDWLNYYGCKFIRLNLQDFIVNIETHISNNLSFTIETRNKIIKSEDISAVWYRKNCFEFDFPFYTKQFKKENQIKLNKFAAYELGVIRNFIRKSLREKSILGKSIITQNLNKLEVLVLANEVGLEIPKTKILCNKNKIPSSNQIIKAIGEVEYFDSWKKRLIPYTISLSKDLIKEFPNTFFPTLFQDEIDKKYEVRVFHLNGINYSMAIFSQKNKKTKTDFRKYDLKNPNRTVPYILPKDIEKKINALMHKLDLDTGSIDFIVDVNERFYFLEVNPVGQFGMVSLPCNYYLEKKIADSLIELIN